MEQTQPAKEKKPLKVVVKRYKISRKMLHKVLLLERKGNSVLRD